MLRNLKFHRLGVFQLLSCLDDHFGNWQVFPPSPSLKSNTVACTDWADQPVEKQRSPMRGRIWHLKQLAAECREEEQRTVNYLVRVQESWGKLWWISKMKGGKKLEKKGFPQLAVRWNVKALFFDFLDVKRLLNCDSAAGPGLTAEV